MSMVEKKPSNAREHCTKCDLQTYDNGRDIDEKTCEKMWSKSASFECQERDKKLWVKTTSEKLEGKIENL